MRFKPSLLNRALLAPALLPVLLLSACSLAPVYTRPTTATIPAGFKEAPGWRAAVPSDAVARGEWWRLFNDPVLDGLERRVATSNQTLAAAKATYDQAQALVRQQRAGWFPSLALSASGTRGNAAAAGSGAATDSSPSAPAGNRYAANIGATWEPDFWGRVGNEVAQASAQADAARADLANAQLSLQGELALDYVQLRGVDAQKAALIETVAAHERALTITGHLYDAGVVARSDVLQAETALYNARADSTTLDVQRAALEHAIAVLVGESPSTFQLAAAPWHPVVPDVPSVLPSAVLERRPDIAAAERLVAAANAAIGIQRAAYFPTIELTANKGFEASVLGSLFAAGSSAWSLGVSGLLTLLDFGARSAQVDQARDAYLQAVANYRQTVLVAFQQTEDQLAATRSLADVAVERTAAARSANQAETIARNQYQAGLIAYSGVIVAQTTALSARTAAVQAVINRQTAAISLVQAIGGHWSSDDAATAGQPGSHAENIQVE